LGNSIASENIVLLYHTGIDTSEEPKLAVHLRSVKAHSGGGQPQLGGVILRKRQHGLKWGYGNVSPEVTSGDTF